MTGQTRREYLLGLGTLGAVGLAGCSGSGRPTLEGTPRPTLSEEFSFDGYLEPAANFDRSVVDAHGQSKPTVLVGAAGNGGARAFAPPAISVDPGTTVVWEWSGQGGAHNVVSENGEFESELTTDEDYTFEQTLDSEGIFKYYCAPHLRNGMKGVVRVGNRPE